MSRRTLSIILLILLVSGLGLTTVFSHLQPRHETVQRPLDPDVTHNPYLAAEAFLRQQGVEVNSVQTLGNLDQLPPQGHTLLLLGRRSSQSPRQAEQLLDWARRGGHLLWVAEQVWDEEQQASGDYLLDGTGIRQYLHDEDSPDGTRSQKRLVLSHLQLPKQAVDARLAFHTRYHLEVPDQQPLLVAGSAHANHLLQLPLGRGTVTVVSDAWLWDNASIGRYDHAWALWYLTQGTVVTLVRHGDAPSLLAQLLRYFPQACAALLLLLLAGLWYHGMRTGPVQAPAASNRRQLQEHLHATAHFRARYQGRGSLLEQVQQDLLRHIDTYYPHLHGLSDAALWQALAKHSGMPADRIERLMTPATASLSAAEFTSRVARLQQLRNAL